MARSLLCLLGAWSLAGLGCHPPPDALVDASRVVVVVGPPQIDFNGSRNGYRETPMQTLDPAACAAACKGVAKAGEQLGACFATPGHAFTAQPQKDVPLQPASVHVCTIR